MKFIYTGGPYTEFRGYVFVNGKPTTISDRATLDALALRQDFKQYVEPVASPVVAPAVVQQRKKLRLPNKGLI